MRICARRRAAWPRRGPAGRRAPRPGRRRRRWPGPRRSGRAAAADEVDGRELVQAHGVVDDHDLGRHLGHPARASSISARSAVGVDASSRSSSTSSDRRRPGTTAAGRRISRSPMLAIRCQRLLTSANLPGTTELKRGPAPPGHPHPATVGRTSTVRSGCRACIGRCSRRSRGRRSSDRPRRWAVRRRLGARRRHHRFPGGAAHCAGVIGHSPPRQRAPDQRPHPRP